jgi:putative tryptophan/tyrosine transport system substrate-binding protein
LLRFVGGLANPATPMATMLQLMFVWQKVSGIDYRSSPLIWFGNGQEQLLPTPMRHRLRFRQPSIPIVFVTGSDPVAAGFVPNLNHPGGNVTGVSFFNEGLISKRLAILHELVPKAESIALLVDPNYFRAETELRELNMGGQALGQKVIIYKASSDREIDAAFAAIAQAKVSAILVGLGAFLTSRRHQIVQLVALQKIPAIYIARLYTEAGGLISYGASAPDAYRRAGVYVARILKGEKPGDLPVELPTKFELVINLSTAKALGLTVPPSVLALADEVIE